MLAQHDFIKQSLALHLFFARIMKEHSFFLEIGFAGKDKNLINQADYYRKAFDALLADVIKLSDGVVNRDILESGEVFTPYTMKAELVSSNLTGVPINIELTKAEANLTAGNMEIKNQKLEKHVHHVNNDAIDLLKSLIQFKTAILTRVLSCNLFTVNYPLLIDHILREAKLYLQMVQRLQAREEITLEKEAFEQEAFWNKIMAEHAKFIRGLLDPTENELFKVADNFGNEFDALTNEAIKAMDNTMAIQNVTAKDLKSTQQIRDFKEQGTQGLLDCKIKSIIIPLLGDHVLREANHYLRLLKLFGTL